MTISFEDTIREKIREAIDKQVEIIKNDIAKSALEEFEAQVRKVLSLVIIRLLDSYSIERLGSELRIVVNIDKVI